MTIAEADVPISAAEFKARCLKLMDEVARTGRPLVITKRGRPLVRLLPAQEEPRATFGCLRGSTRIVGDIVASAGETWSAETGDEDPLYFPSPSRRGKNR